MTWSVDVVTGGRPKLLSYAQGSSVVFSADGKHAVVALSHQLRVYFVSTRQCIRVVDLDLHRLAEMRLDGAVAMLFMTLGEIVSVNWKDRTSGATANGIVVSSHQTTVDSLLSVVHVSKQWYYFVSGKRDKKVGSSSHTRNVVRVLRATPTHQHVVVYEARNVLRYAHSPDETKMAFVTSDNETVVVDLGAVYRHENDENDMPIDEQIDQNMIDEEIIAFPYKSKVTSVAVSNDVIIALGTAAGPIQLLYGGLNAEKPQGLLKWHIDQVRSLQFTSDSTYLLSGGLEKVLVLWQLETGKTQFLPRLNGAIEKISIDANKPDYYNMLLNVSSVIDSNSNANYEVVSISAVDLVSRLAVTSIKPKMANDVVATLARTRKKYLKLRDGFDATKLRYDYSSVFEVNPKSKHLYFPNDAAIQAYDVVRNEQLYVQNSAPVVATGKVRLEARILDPSISLLAFTADGEWMCTFDTVSTSEIDNLLSKNDKQYALKFWKYIDTGAATNTNSNSSANGTANGSRKNGYWELSTKIIDPHGNTNPILAVEPAPSSYHDGVAFLTADSKGGLRIWRPRVPVGASSASGKQQQTAWTIRKSRPGFAQSASDAVDVCWSEDGSLVVLAHEHSLTPILVSTFEIVSSFQIPSLSGSTVRSVSILDSNLVVLSQSRISSFNLLTGQLNELVAGVNVSVGGRHNIAVNHTSKLVCVAVNYYEVNDDVEDDVLQIKSKIIVFKPDSLQPLYVHNYHTGVSSVRSYNSSFVFVDLDARVGVLQAAAEEGDLHQEEDLETPDLTQAMKAMLLNAHATADVINNRTVSVKARKINNLNNNNTSNNADEIDIDAVDGVSKQVDVHTFQPVFENIEGVQLENLFERIVRIIR